MGGPPGGPSQRLNELLDNIRTEFETESQRSVNYEDQSKSLLRSPGDCSSPRSQRLERNSFTPSTLLEVPLFLSYIPSNNID